MSWITSFLEELVFLTEEMAPYLLLGFLVAGMLKVWFPDQHVRKYLGKPGFKSSFYAALAGVPMPLCSCGVIPTGISLYKNGASKGATSSFLISTPQTGVDSILATYSLLGLPFAIIRPFVALVTGIFGGMLSTWLDRSQHDPALAGRHNLAVETIQPGGQFRRIFSYGFGELVDDIAKWLVIGLLLAAAMSVLIPESFFTQYVGNPLFEMGLVLLASVPLYLCATGSIPLAAVLLMKGLSPGAALVLLMAGPATNIATMTVIGKAMGSRSLLWYMVSIIFGALAFGFLINWLVPAGWFDLSHVHHHDHGFLPGWLKTGSAILISFLILRTFVMKWLRRRTTKKQIKVHKMQANNQIIVRIDGMTCHHCQKSVEVNLQKLKGVEEVRVQLETGTAEISGQVSPDEVKKTVEELGYTYVGLT